MKARYMVSKTYSVVTHESAETGSESDSGFEFKSVKMDLQDVLGELEELGAIDYFDGSSAYGADPDIDYETGEHTTYALHISGPDSAMRWLNVYLERNARRYGL
jgi:hypothetical protein